MDYFEITEDLTYISFRQQRELGLKPEQLDKAGFPNVKDMERKFQLERVNSFMERFYVSQE